MSERDRLIAAFSLGLNVLPERLDENTSPDNTPEWDSLAAMSLVSALEETFGVEFSTAEILRMRSISVAREVLRSKGIGDV